MGLGGCYSFIKYLMVFMNFFFFIISLLIIALASWMLYDYTFYVSMAFDSNNYTISVCILLFCGLLLFLVSFFGCCGASRESQCMLISFFCILLVIVVAQIASAIWMYSNSDKLEAMIRYNVKTTVQEEYHKDSRLREIFDTIQQGLECCGAELPSDWNGGTNIVVGASLEERRFDIPRSCCKVDQNSMQCTDATQNLLLGKGIDFGTIHSKGCVSKVVDVVHDNMFIAAIIGIALIVIEFIGLIFSLILAFAVNSSNHYKR